MTILEAVNATIGFTYDNEDVVLKALKDLGLLPESEYNQVIHQKLVDIAAINALMAFKLLSKIDEGRFSVTFNEQAVNDLIAFLYGRSGEGLPNPLPEPDQPKITDFSNRW